MSEVRPALSQFSDDENSFREAILGFAESEINPLVTNMDEQA
ncbi:MAG: acyl-CoA dehydrogenase, partial [Bdellovibrionales bacterium]|nr:acyl-CoA dehydrogenase [Bdellovibrionales bacterium]